MRVYWLVRPSSLMCCVVVLLLLSGCCLLCLLPAVLALPLLWARLSLACLGVWLRNPFQVAIAAVAVVCCVMLHGIH